MNNKISMIATGLTALLALSPAAGFPQGTTTFSGEAVALKADAVGVSPALADTGALPSSGGNLSTSLANINVAGIAAADTLSSSTSASGTTGQSQSTLQDVNLLNGLVAATAVPPVAMDQRQRECGTGRIDRRRTSDPCFESEPFDFSARRNQRHHQSADEFVWWNERIDDGQCVACYWPSIDMVVASAQSDITCS